MACRTASPRILAGSDTVSYVDGREEAVLIPTESCVLLSLLPSLDDIAADSDDDDNTVLDCGGCIHDVQPSGTGTISGRNFALNVSFCAAISDDDRNDRDDDNDDGDVQASILWGVVQI